ncbi:MAG TPA: energy transducer TonB [Planktothrix sp.]|jgi:TonB family protein
MKVHSPAATMQSLAAVLLIAVSCPSSSVAKSTDIKVTPEMRQYLTTVSKMAQDKWLQLRSKQDWKAVDKAWTQKKPSTESQVTVATAFDEKGKPLNPKVSKSSGNSALDGLAVDAVKQAAPYPAPPKQAANLGVQINFVAHLPPKDPSRVMIPLKVQ